MSRSYLERVVLDLPDDELRSAMAAVLDICCAIYSAPPTRERTLTMQRLDRLHALASGELGLRACSRVKRGAA